jgi:hypothetical protein
VRGGLRALREGQAASRRKKAEEKLGFSLNHASPRLITWLARPF